MTRTSPDQAHRDHARVMAQSLLAWYDRHRRDLPWRARPGETADPYRVWLSEIMLQQTTVAAVRDYFLRFVARWPDVEALASAPSTISCANGRGSAITRGPAISTNAQGKSSSAMAGSSRRRWTR
ncbi:hypothetical protein [Kaustia mangrovi]|uniref:hypothetical protein n=1 Tax=Kaustia mangrovi TaxID=2593653 RepID=UPI0031B64361